MTAHPLAAAGAAPKPGLAVKPGTAAAAAVNAKPKPATTTKAEVAASPINGPAAAAAPPRPAPGGLLVLFGRDAAGKRRAARFPAAQATGVEKAAGLMGLQILQLTEPGQVQRAGALPLGRLFASGRALVPLVQGRILDAVLGSQAAAPSGPKPSADADFVDEPEVGVPVASRAAITVGSLVLVGEAHPLCGWYEATVVTAPGDDLFTLRWRDWPDDPLVARRREDLALLPPGSLAAAGVAVGEDAECVR